MLNFVLTSDESWRAKNSQKPLKILKILQKQNLQNQTTSELCIGDNKLNCSSNPKGIFKSAKKNYEKLYTKETASQSAITEFLSKISSRKKISNEKFNLCTVKISLDEKLYL